MSICDAVCATPVVMRKLLFIVTLAWLISAFATAAPAWASPRHDHITGVAGFGTLGQFGDPTVIVNAVQTRAHPNGAFIIRYPDRTFVFGPATCLFVSGHTAYLTGRITFSSGPRQQAEGWFPGSYIIIGVQDNGATGPDLLNFSPGFVANPGCGPNAAATPVFPITRGHYHVFGGD